MKLVHAHGTFDGLHVGHLYYLKAARALGDVLVVTITSSRWVAKGSGRPVFSDAERMEMIRSLRFVSAALMNDEPVPNQIIRELKPDIYVKGKEYAGRLPEQKLVEELGGKVVFLDTKPVYSSTEILTGKLLAKRIKAARRSRN